MERTGMNHELKRKKRTPWTGTETRRSGSVLPIVTVSIVLFFMMLAFALDLGMIQLSKSELQNAADAAALAGAAQLLDEDFLDGTKDQSDDIVDSRDFAQSFAGQNYAAGRFLSIDRNDSNDPNGGVLVGYLADPKDLNSPMETDGVPEYNSVQVRAELAQVINGPLALFCGAFLGMDEVEIGADSTATMDDRIIGFRITGDERLPLLPFTINVNLWDQGFPGDPIGASAFHFPIFQMFRLLAGISCHWTSQDVLQLYPNYPGEQGNFGTLDIGPEDNSTAEIIDQILYGPTVEDIAYIGGLVLEQNDSDVFIKWLQGDTGVSTAIQSAVNTIKGQPRLIPLHRSYCGTGNNMMYEVVRFAGVKVVNVQMTGALAYRHIDVVPCQVTTPTAVVHPQGPGSNLVYSLSLSR